jgi:putative addiction module component (TIGR02574 family)
MPTSLPPEILALPVSQRMELAAQIWDSIQPSEIELSEEYRRILDERLAKYEADPTEGRPWEEVKAELFKKQ